jgi:outer membrane protein assembly factor BamB
VLEAGAEWKLLAVNDLGEEVTATPALVDGRVYVRTRDSLYCFTAEGARSAGAGGAPVLVEAVAPR